MGCPLGSDRSFGPRVNSGCRSFDFTLEFEDALLTSSSAGLFLLLSFPLALVLIQKHVVYSLNSKLLSCKLIAFLGAFIAQLILLSIRVRSEAIKSESSLAADILCTISIFAAGILSFLSHQRSERPLTVLNLYLSASVLFGVIKARTLWLLASRTEDPSGAITMTMLVALFMALLSLESVSGTTKKTIAAIPTKTYPTAPEQHSSFWSRTSFSWLVSTFRSGYAKILILDDLPPLDTNLQSHTMCEKVIIKWDRYDHKRPNSLLRACVHAHLASFLSPIIPRLFITGFTFAQPFLINATLDFIDQKQRDVNYAKGLVGAWALVYLGLAASNSIYQYQSFRFVTRLRGSLITLIYQRTLQTRSADMGEITAVSLMGTDVERIWSSLQTIHDTWGSLLEIGIASWLLGRQVSLSCIAPLLLVLVFIAATSRISFYLKDTQILWIERVQERLRATSAMLGDIKAVKMLGLSGQVLPTIQELRDDEIQTSQSYRKYLIAMLMLSLTPLNLAPVITFGVYTIIASFWKHESLLTAKAFTSLSLISLVTTPVLNFIQVLPMVVQSIGNFDRIQQYCNYAGGVDANNSNDENGKMKESIKLKGHRFSWDRFNSSPVLQDIGVDIKREGITAIVGPVGSGKSSFLSAILGELSSIQSPIESYPTEHQKELKGHQTNQLRGEAMAYCTQQPWLESGTIRQNVLCAATWDQKWYDTVTFACCLDGDLAHLKKGDFTEVGSKGANLSGGQKQRIALARAVYSRRDVILLDDVFSGMDGHTTQSISNRLFSHETGLLRKNKTTVILATHNDKILSLADTIIALDGGKVVNVGSPTSVQINNKISRDILLSGTDHLEENIDSDELDEIVNESDIIATTSRSPYEEQSNAVSAEDSQFSPLQDTRRKNGESSVYSYYLASSGYIAVGLYTISMALWVFCIEFSTIWVDWWSSANSAHPNQKLGMYLGVYAMLAVIGTIAACLSAWFAIINIISNSASRLHFDLLKSTLRAPFRFFTVTDNGELLNRFSEDMELIDMDLPTTALNYTSTAFTVLAQVTIMAVFSRSLGVALPIIFAFMYILQRFYLQTSRQMRLLMIEAKAPLYTLFSEAESTSHGLTGAARGSGDGATTIRAFNWQDFYQERASALVDQSQRPAYMQSCIQHWLSFVMNVTMGVLAVILVATVVTWENQLDITTGGVGVSLVIIMGLSENLTRLIKEWTKLESSIGAVARVKRFVDDTEQEDLASSVQGTGSAYDLTHQWSESGSIEFDRVVASFGPGPDTVLKGISISIQPGEHVAICGRSGSGKTSLVLSLLRMMDVLEGRILLDGIEISDANTEPLISVDNIRARINVVPQDPFLLPGKSLRFNLDVSGICSDEEIIRVLERVKVWHIVRERGGLDERVDNLALSAGQKQLLCFARAMIKRKVSNILVLDEATSSLDTETESLIQGIINVEFKECTIVSVMHRLAHVTSYDKVALLDSGSLVEFGEPSALLAAHTRFAQLFRSSAFKLLKIVFDPIQ
ncbi:ABC transporter [Penicillium verhagenii]|uniref:ABC transporter n=1 Tax=Penicillium verhagenii TaxID=1562060 RepID=UPI0025453147|nr:ABC transporter [Penicillium verhagenii]KAJ5939096.1 ABC transporter [Penicillium verhagenii]